MTSPGTASASSATAGHLLIVDDDATFRAVLERAMRRRGFAVESAADVDHALALARRTPPTHAVVDLRMPGRSGLALLPELRRLGDGTMQIVVLTGYASIATAVEAIKLGATQYLAKPADADDIVAAFAAATHGDASVPIRERPPGIERVERDHIHHVLAAHDGNVSATARALGMHRRTLQRKLAKRPPPG
jgi:two-component system response regulator RegA